MGIADLSRLDIISAQFLASLWLLAGLSAVWVARAARHGRRVRTMLARSAVLVVCLVASVADTVNANYAYLPTVEDAARQLPVASTWASSDRVARFSTTARSLAGRDGTTLVFRPKVVSQRHNQSNRMVVYLPPQYFTEPARRFPVVYLLHGSPGRPEDWFYGGRADDFGRRLASLGKPAILVAPQMSNSWLDDSECVDGSSEQVETRFIHVDIPAVDTAFRTTPDRDHRVFAGMSAGGFCALNLGLRHRDVVATLIDMSGDTSPSHAGGLGRLFGLHTPDLAGVVASNSPAVYAPRLSPSPPMRIWLDCGSGDRRIERELASFAANLPRRGFTVVNRLRSGGHTYRVWTDALADSLPWAVADDAREASTTRPATAANPASVPSAHNSGALNGRLSHHQVR